MSNKELMEKAKEAINAVFGDRSVSQEEALENMETLASDIEGNIDALKDDLRRKDQG